MLNTPDLDPTDAADYLRRALADPTPRRSGLLPSADDYPLNEARGCFYGVLFGTLVWLCIGGALFGFGFLIAGLRFH